MDASNLVGSKGININVGVDTASVIYLTAGVFVAVVLAGIVIKLVTSKM